MNEVQSPPDEASMTGLLRGIINDISDLIRHEVRFAKTEIKADLRKTREAVTVLALGAGTGVLGIILLAWMLVHLLHWLSYPAGTAADPAAIPLWGCYGIVSAVFLVIGAALGWMGYKKFESFNPLPDQTVQSVKENVEWIANSK